MDEQKPLDARHSLIVLTAMNLVNYLDRYVVPAVQESIRKEMALSDQQVGLLSTGFVVVLMVASPFFGILGDRHPRTRLIGCGVALWSVATATSGLAPAFWALLLCRMAVGIGEAAYGTIAPAVLSDCYPRKVRGRAFSVFYSAICIGTALGYVVGGSVDKLWGWRHAFYLTAVPGLLLAVLAFRLSDPPRGSQEDDGAENGAGTHSREPDLNIISAYSRLWHNRVYMVTVVGYAAGTFAIGGLGVWMPTFLIRERGLQHAAEIMGGLMAFSGLLGTISGGWIGDYFARTTRQAYLWVAGLSSLLAVPFTMIALRSPVPGMFLPAIFVAAFLVFVSTGPVNTLIVNVVPPTMRATALAACTLAIHLFGDAPSPYLIGFISDHAHSLAQAMLVVPVIMAVSGLIWTAAAWIQGRPAETKQIPLPSE